MKREFFYTAAATLALAVAFVVTPALSGDKAPADKAPMPETRGMQGMDPKLHDQPAEDPYKDCKANAGKAAQQAEHPMPATKGMKDMDPKAHTVDCPAADAPREKPAHVHK